MIESLDALLRQYESGTLSRRDLLGAMALMAAPAQAQDAAGVVTARSLHHVNVRVTDLARSEAFYRRVFRLPSSRRVIGDAFALDLPGGGFISLCPTTTDGCGAVKAGTPGDIDHVCLALEGFDQQRTAKRLRDAGVSAEISDDRGIWIEDPDGTPIQLTGARETFAPR